MKGEKLMKDIDYLLMERDLNALKQTLTMDETDVKTSINIILNYIDRKLSYQPMKIDISYDDVTDIITIRREIKK